MWTSRKPYVGHLRVFGCVAHMMVAKYYPKKLDKRSRNVVHLGNEKGTKAYRLSDPDTGLIYVSINFVFEEDKIWMWETTTKIRGTQGMSFTVEGFNFNNKGFVGEENIDEEDGSIPVTPDDHQSLENVDWTDSESQPNYQMDTHTSPHESPSHSLTSLNSPSTPNSPISPNSSSTASSSTGGSAPKRYCLISNLYEAT